jgi:hypothetical protein
MSAAPHPGVVFRRERCDLRALSPIVSDVVYPSSDIDMRAPCGSALAPASASLMMNRVADRQREGEGIGVPTRAVGNGEPGAASGALACGEIDHVSPPPCCLDGPHSADAPGRLFLARSRSFLARSTEGRACSDSSGAPGRLLLARSRLSLAHSTEGRAFSDSSGAPSPEPRR